MKNKIIITPINEKGELAIKTYIDEMRKKDYKKAGLSKVKAWLINKTINTQQYILEEYSENPLCLMLTIKKEHFLKFAVFLPKIEFDLEKLLEKYGAKKTIDYNLIYAEE